MVRNLLNQKVRYPILTHWKLGSALIILILVTLIQPLYGRMGLMKFLVKESI